jgi:signal transduction histidine kinase
VLGTILLGLIAIPAEWQRLEMVCTVAGSTDACPEPHLTPHALRQLTHLGLSRGTFAGFFLLVAVLDSAVFVSLAILLLRRRPGDTVAILAALFLLTFGVTNSLDFSASAQPVLIWPVLVLKSLGSAALMLFLFLFPNGRFIPRWTRWVAGPAALATVVYALAPGALTSSQILNGTLFVAFILAAAIGLFDQFYRYRKVANGTERQQVKMVVFGIAVTIVGVVAIGISQTISASGMDDIRSIVVNSLVWYGFIAAIPLSLGLSILRYHLWDIDFIINRALVYGALTVTVVAFYVLVVAGIGALLQTRANLPLSLAGAGAVALVSQPWHAWLQRTVNRFMYGERDDPYRVIERLGQRLEGSVSSDAVLPAIAEIIGQALKLPWVAISLENERVALWGERRDRSATLPLVWNGAAIGAIALGLRAGERQLTQEDRRVVELLARQAGAAAHAVLLTEDLRRSRELLVSTREEERRRLRRDLHDGLGPSLATLNLKLDAARNLVRRDPEATEAVLVGLKGQVQDAIGDIRRLVYGLRPPSLDELGLVSAIQEQAHQYGGSDLTVTVEAGAVPNLPAAVEVAAYRIVQEALTNVARHAHARTATVRIEYGEGALTVRVSDDGIGLPADRSPGVGIRSMCERSEELFGECSVTTLPRGGTCVVATLPCGGVA